VFQPAFEREDAMRLAADLGVEVTVVPYDILSHPEVASNPSDRCYHCKTALFGALRDRAAADGYTVLIDGTNASDEAGDRPGMRALVEMSVRSPLRECGLTKADVRRLSREAGLFTWDKPAYACLSTRIPTGRPVEAGLLARVEAAEAALFAMGFSDFRVRVYGEAARLQFRAADLGSVVERREEILAGVQPHFETVLLDLQPR
ncbi:MAG: ATP-dependent sacrificial sulfur transferase LarE, partial [Clostridiaceae bacterium]|nr:ATP-dependent sacrificial sulfur transferase LarE [Clostridiaceae bacterium]